MAAAEEIPPSKGATITHVIFDLDGTLLDSEPFYTIAQEKMLERFGKTFDLSLKPKLMGKKAIESAHIFVEETGLTGILTPEAFLEERERMLQDMFPSCELLPELDQFWADYVIGAVLTILKFVASAPLGVRRLISHLHANGIPMAVATGSHKRHFKLKTQRHGEIFSMMHHVVIGDDPEVKKGKPSPDVFLAAARRFEDNVDPSKILVFEDAPAGVTAAKNAGMSVLMIPMTPDPKLDASYHKDADQVLSSVLDFNPSNWGLPPFEDVVN